MPPTGSAGVAAAATPLTWFDNGSPVITTTQGAANQVYVNGFALPYPITFGHIYLRVATPDAANNYDIGLYTQAGSLITHIGPQTLPTTGYQTFAFLGGAKTLTPGLYVFAWTGLATTAALVADNVHQSWNQNNNYAASSSGTLPASIPALGFNQALVLIEFVLLT
jgi:hypothetical protein